MTVIKRREGWPTPCASGDLHYRLKGGSQASRCLAVAVYPTPTARDAAGCSPNEKPRDKLCFTVERGETKSHIYPTPRALSLCGGTGSYQQIKSYPNLTDDEKRALIASAGRCAEDYDTPTYIDENGFIVAPSVFSVTGEIIVGIAGRKAQLNPDWEEWLMAWPVGWTDLETPNIRLVWLDPSIDPADYGEIPRVTNRRDNRAARVKELGNGQFPLAAAVAFHWGICVLERQSKKQPFTQDEHF